MRREKTTEILRHNFTQREINEKANTLAQACQRLTAAEEEKKAAASQYTERITTEKALIGKTSREMNQGWETRPVDCKIIYNMPNTGIKSIYRIDTEELVKTASMDQDELQDTLFEDPKLAEDPKDVTERNIRNFFGMKPAVPTTEDPLEIQAWKSGEWVVAAASAEFAQQWMEHRNLPCTEPFEWADTDTTIIPGPEEFYGRTSLPARAAIVYLQEQEVAFPMLLKIPEDYLKTLHEGKDPQKPAEPETPTDVPTSEEPKPKKKRAPRKPKGTDSTPAPASDDVEKEESDGPAAEFEEDQGDVDQRLDGGTQDGFGVDLGEDEDDDSLEPGE